MATNPPSFFNPESISYDQYSKGPVDFYNQALDTSSLAGTGIGVTNPDDITDLKQYGIAGPTNRVEDQGDTQDDALNALDDTSIQGDNVGGSMFPGGTGIEYNNFNAWDKYDSYQGYLDGEKPPGTQDRWSTEAGSKGLADRVGADLKDTKLDGKGIVKGATLASGNFIMAGLGSVLTTTTTVQNAFGNISARPDGVLGFVTDKLHERQYGDMAHNRAVARAHGIDYQSAMTMDGEVDEDAYATQGGDLGRTRGQRDIGFSMQFGSGTGASGITRRAGTASYTGNLRGMDFGTLKNIEAVQRGFVPSTFNRGFGFDYSGKGAMTFEDAGYSGPLSGGGRYTSSGSYMDKYGRTSMMGLASHLDSFAAKNGLSVAEAAKALANTRKGQGKLMDNIKAAKAAKTQAAADAAKGIDRAANAQAMADARASQIADRDAGGSYEDSGSGQDEGGAADSGSGGGQVGSEEGGFDGAKGGQVTAKGFRRYAMGTPPAGVQASQTGFVDRPPSQVSEAGKVADDRPMKAPEGMYVINAAAVEFAGEQDIRKMIMDAQKEAVRRGLSTGDFERHSDLVDIAVSRGEVTVAPHLVDIIGEDRLEKINKRGLRKTEQRIAENGQEPVQAAGGGFITRKKFAKGDRVTLYRGEPLDPSKVTATDYGYGKEDVGKFHTPDVKKAGRFASGAGKGNQVIKSRKATINELFDGVLEAMKTQGKKKTEYFAKMPKSELNKNLRFIEGLKRDYLSGKRSLESMTIFLQEQVFHDDKSRINFIETFKNDPKSAGKLAGRAIAKVATVATPPLAILAGAAEMLTPSSLGKGTLYDDSFMSYQRTPDK